MWCFFFKQKTAYEMRISDWSSDVCSSDLEAHGTPTITYVEGDNGEGINVVGSYCQKGNVDINPPPNDDYTGDVEDPYRNSGPCNDFSPAWEKCKIGRASCRERVCQYV